MHNVSLVQISEDMTGPTARTTRRKLIDPALDKAGWDVNDPSQVGIEIPVDGFDPAAWQRLDKKLRETGGTYTADLPSGKGFIGYISLSFDARKILFDFRETPASPNIQYR